MGLGKAGAIHAAKAGGLLSVVLLSGYRVIDYFLTDQATLGQLIGTLSTDDSAKHHLRKFVSNRPRLY